MNKSALVFISCILAITLTACGKTIDVTVESESEFETVETLATLEPLEEEQETSKTFDDIIHDIETNLDLRSWNMYTMSTPDDTARLIGYCKWTETGTTLWSVVRYTSDGSWDVYLDSFECYDISAKICNITEYAADYQEFPDNTMMLFPGAVTAGVGTPIQAWVLHDDGLVTSISDIVTDNYSIGVRVNGGAIGDSATYPVYWDEENLDVKVYPSEPLDSDEIAAYNIPVDNIISADIRSNSTIDVVYQNTDYISCKTFLVDDSGNIIKEVSGEDGYGFIYVVGQDDGITTLAY
jgi:hypothetical protein